MHVTHHIEVLTTSLLKTVAVAWLALYAKFGDEAMDTVAVQANFDTAIVVPIMHISQTLAAIAAVVVAAITVVKFIEEKFFSKKDNTPKQ